MPRWKMALPSLDPGQINIYTPTDRQTPMREEVDNRLKGINTKAVDPPIWQNDWLSFYDLSFYDCQSKNSPLDLTRDNLQCPGGTILNGGRA